tara:strand:- start:444 stop:782 length:339 start_codon:yes stop_codon:yes gene_type:complete
MSVSEFLSRANKTIIKKAEITEVDIEKTFVKYAKKKGCHALKLIFLNKKGFPDRTILCPQGRILFIEFKRKGKKQSPVQIIVMELLKSLGFDYYVCDAKGQAEKILDEFLAF